LKFLDRLIEQTPDLYIDELQAALQEELQVEVCSETIWRELLRRGLTRKKVCFLPKESAAYYTPASSFRSLQLNIMKKHEPLSGCTWGKTTELTSLYLSMKRE